MSSFSKREGRWKHFKNILFSFEFLFQKQWFHMQVEKVTCNSKIYENEFGRKSKWGGGRKDENDVEDRNQGGWHKYW